MRQHLIIILTTLCVATSSLAADGNPLLPLPAELEPNVRFWTRIYTEVDTKGGLIHDDRHLDVVYETIRIPKGLSRRARERLLGKSKKHYSAILRRLATGKRDALTEEEARVLARWPEGVTNKTLRSAAYRLRFQLGQSDRFREGLIRSGNWIDVFRQTMVDRQVPVELAALPHVESSFNPRAYSHVGAAGLWQFTRSTGRRYLRIDNVVDERMDPEKATVAAARLLLDNYARLDSWPLAITAYNHGVGGMARAVKKLKTRDLGKISRDYNGRTFGFASRNFYSEFLAASEIDQNPERYFGAIQRARPIQYAVLETDHYYMATTLERALGVKVSTLRDHNLALRSSVWTGAKLIPKSYPLKIPADIVQTPFVTALANIPSGKRLSEQRRDRFHKVRRGESLSKIASRYRVKERELVALNNLRSRHRIRAGQVLRLPDDGRARVVRVSRIEPPADGIYRVRRGDNITVIGQRFGVTSKLLLGWNRLKNPNQLTVGQRLRVSAPAVASAAKPQTASVTPPVLAVAPKPQSIEAAIETEAVAPAEPASSSPVVVAVAQPEPSLAEIPTGEVVIVAGSDDPVPLPDPSNYAVHPNDQVTIQAEETLGHYAEWLEVSASDLRRLNGMSYGTALAIGRQKKLDFSRVTPEVFEQRRLQFHRGLQEDFFNAYIVTGTLSYSLRRGDSLWYISNRKFDVPIWLLRQYNPDLDFGKLHAGTPLVIPVIEARSERS
jgi:membrane-bound lytic murein transglycosylase D